MKRSFLLLTGLSLGLLAGALWFYLNLPQWAGKNRFLAEPLSIELAKGARLNDLAQKLQEDGLIDHALRFRFWVKFYGDYGRFQAGVYRFQGDVSPKKIVETIEAGRIWQPAVIQFVIPEGFTLKQVIDRLEAHNVGHRAELESEAKKLASSKNFRIQSKSIEGYLFPATYSFIAKPSARAALEKMVQTFFAQLPSDIEAGLAERKLTLHQGVIFASLIERETQVEEERSKVSEVIWNRLKDGEPLGIDAALIYGIKDYQGDIKTIHLQDASNLYNTRIHKGLPPSPIGAISMASLKAVLTPTQNGYRFYCLGIDGSKLHHFSKTLAEHEVFVKKLIQAYRNP